MERHCRNLEAEADHQHDRGEEQHGIREVSAAQERQDAIQVRRARHAVQERHAVHHDADEKAPNRRYLMPASLDRLSLRIEPGQDVDGQGHELQTQVQRDEVPSRRHEHHAARGEQHQRVILAAMDILDVQELHRDQDTEDRSNIEGQFENR